MTEPPVDGLVSPRSRTLADSHTVQVFAYHPLVMNI